MNEMEDHNGERFDDDPMVPGRLRVVPDPAEDQPASRRGQWRAQLGALPGVIVDRQLNRPLPDGVQERVPGWMQTTPGRIGVALIAVLIMGLWGLGLLLLAGLL